jgi:hypothetical protein
MLRYLSNRALRRSALIVGSGPSAPDTVTWEVQNCTRVAINNAWQVRPDFNFSVYPDDFPSERHPPKSQPIEHISYDQYMPILDRAGGVLFAGATMAFATGYWAIGALRPAIIGYYACDMVYRQGQTHFYGKGTPDPLREDISLQSLEAKSCRLFAWGLKHGALLTNLSTDPDSRLVFPRATLDVLTLGKTGIIAEYLCLTKQKATREVLSLARQALHLESKAPFNALRHDYWMIGDGAANVEFIRYIDAAWLKLQAPIADLRLPW